MTPSDQVPFVAAPTTDTLIKQSRRLLRSLAEIQHDLEHFVSLLQQKGDEEVGGSDERERTESSG